MEAVAIPQTECFAAAMQFARTEGIVPAPEPTHALAAAIGEALAAKESGEEKVILTALCGHGHFDLAAYDAYLAGRDGRRGRHRRPLRRRARHRARRRRPLTAGASRPLLRSPARRRAASRRRR